MKKILNIFSWVVLLLAFAALGLSSDDPVFGFFFYLVFFVIVFGLVYLYIKKHQKRKAINPQTLTKIHKIIAIFIMLVALFSPLIALRKIMLPFLPNFLILIVTAILIAAGAFAISMINSTKKILGYILLIIISIIPALFAISYLDIYFPNTYNALGTAYWATVSVAIFSWWGFSLYFKKE
ncbi:MAG: hypothetical protein K8R49_07340 [Candidatus Cloacimonetes bacterium]|nr:hypothetical protein [Candidatus Cloacimonadota bacterium]